jgi:hypothetical protein
LLEAEAASKEAEVSRLQLEDAHLEFDLYRKAICLALAVIIALIVIVRLISEPGLEVIPGGTLSCLLSWLGGK